MVYNRYMNISKALKAGSTYEAWGSKVNVTSAATNIVEIGTQDLLQIITPILHKNGKTYIDVRDTIESEASLLMTKRGLAMTIVDEMCFDKKQIEDMLNDKYCFDFMKVVGKIEGAMSETYHKAEDTIYFVTLPKYSSYDNVETCTTKYGIKYSFTFYKPYTFDEYDVKKKFLKQKEKDTIEYYKDFIKEQLKFEPDWNE